MITENNITKPTMFTVTQAAQYLGLAVSTLNKWRCHGGGPIFVKMGGAVRYHLDDLETFMNGSRVQSTSDVNSC